MMIRGLYFCLSGVPNMNYAEANVQTKLYKRYERFKTMLEKHKIKISQKHLSGRLASYEGERKDTISFVSYFRHLMWCCGEEGKLPYDYDLRWKIVEKANWLDADDPYPLYKVLMARRGKKGRPKQTAEV
jgi:hypothetical protein